MPGEFVDPYVDPETGVLRNLVGHGPTTILLGRRGSLRPFGWAS